MIKQLILLVGPAGSGKSTYCESMIDFVRINQDEQGKDGHWKEFKSALESNHQIIVDRMNFNKKQRNKYLDEAKQCGYTTTIVVFHVPFETCYERVMNRQNHPTINDLKGKEDKQRSAGSALDTFFRGYERVTDDEADYVLRYGWEDASKSALICDIDGTMCNIDHRKHYVDKSKGKVNWNAFYKEMKNDMPNGWCIELLKNFSKSNEREIVYCSGRPSDYRDDTIQWLIFNVPDEVNSEYLFMRRRNDFRADNIIKEIILEFELKTRFKDLLFIDDRKRVVDMYRSHGYTVLQCDEGNF